MNKPHSFHASDTQTMTRLTFLELRESLSMSDEGQILDSFIAVEIGLDNYEACWEAHNDVYEESGVEADEETIVSLFLSEIYDMLGVEEKEFEKVLGASL